MLIKNCGFSGPEYEHRTVDDFSVIVAICRPTNEPIEIMFGSAFSKDGCRVWTEKTNKSDSVAALENKILMII